MASTFTSKVRGYLPSRNWAIFLGLSTGVGTLYRLDRQALEDTRRQMRERVRYLAEQPLLTTDLPRRVLVVLAPPTASDNISAVRHQFSEFIKPGKLGQCPRLEQI